MKNSLFLVLALVLFACQYTSDTNDKATEEAQDNPAQAAVKDTVQTLPNAVPDYSPAFVQAVKNQDKAQNVEFQQEMMILNGRDTIPFPSEPAIGKTVVLSAKKDNLAAALRFKRINYTSIQYKLELVDLGQSSIEEEGEAHLAPYFFLGGESDVDDQTGLSYFSTEFSIAQDSCYTYLRIGNRNDDPKEAYLAKLIKNCNGEIGDIELDNFPTLIEK
ncbi:MAG: hypothetical protein AAFP19_20690 [Bacteroidota bacterium]